MTHYDTSNLPPLCPICLKPLWTIESTTVPMTCDCPPTNKCSFTFSQPQYITSVCTGCKEDKKKYLEAIHDNEKALRKRNRRIAHLSKKCYKQNKRIIELEVKLEEAKKMADAIKGFLRSIPEDERVFPWK